MLSSSRALRYNLEDMLSLDDLQFLGRSEYFSIIWASSCCAVSFKTAQDFPLKVIKLIHNICGKAPATRYVQGTEVRT